MRILILTKRNIKEILRDPLTVFFGIGFPIVLLLLLSLIQSNVPVEMFVIDRLAPGVAVFGLSFISLFSGFLISKDRGSAFLMRLYSSPIKPYEFIIAYILPFIPLSLLQSLACVLVSIPLGLEINVGIPVMMLMILPVAFMYIGFGILAGAFFSDKQVGGICGALLTNLSAWLSGIWFDISLLGNTLERIAYCLPFANAVKLVTSGYSGNMSGIISALPWVMGYVLLLFGSAVITFSRKIKSDSK